MISNIFIGIIIGLTIPTICEVFKFLIKSTVEYTVRIKQRGKTYKETSANDIDSIIDQIISEETDKNLKYFAKFKADIIWLSKRIYYFCKKYILIYKFFIQNIPVYILGEEKYNRIIKDEREK